MSIHTKPKIKKKIRYAEYYDMTKTFDTLYHNSQQGKIFTNLMEIILSEENIKLAYRTIKGNSGSNTAGTDGKTIKDVNAKFVYLEINSLDFQKVRLFLSMTEVLKILEDIRI